jgi:hypothetical protein
MRCGRYRLAAKVKESSLGDPLSGHLFLFFSKNRASVKILYFDVSGFVVWHKVLERGRYAIPKNGGEIDSLEYKCLLEGVSIEKLARKPHFSMPKQLPSS